MLVLVLIAVTSANSTSESKTPYAPKTYDKMMVCHLVQDSRVNEVLARLEAKMDNLIALVSNVCTAKPRSTGRLRHYFVNMFSKSCFLRARYNCHQPEVCFLLLLLLLFFFSLLIQPCPCRLVRNFMTKTSELTNQEKRLKDNRKLHAANQFIVRVQKFAFNLLPFALNLIGRKRVNCFH